MDNMEIKKRASQSHPEDNEREIDLRKDELCKDAGKPKAVLSDRAVSVVFFSLLVDLLAFTVILPLFPSLLEFYASNREVGNTLVLAYTRLC